MAEVSLSTKDRNNEKPQSWKVKHTNFSQSAPPVEIMMWGKKCLWRPEVLLQGNFYYGYHLQLKISSS